MAHIFRCRGTTIICLRYRVCNDSKLFVLIFVGKIMYQGNKPLYLPTKNMVTGICIIKIVFFEYSANFLTYCRLVSHNISKRHKSAKDTFYNRLIYVHKNDHKNALGKHFELRLMKHLMEYCKGFYACTCYKFDGISLHVIIFLVFKGNKKTP